MFIGCEHSSFIRIALGTALNLVLVGSVLSYIDISKEMIYCTHPKHQNEMPVSTVNSAVTTTRCRPKLYLSLNIQNNVEVSPDLFI